MERIREDRQKGYRAFLLVLLAAALIGCGFYYIYSLKNMIPNTLNLSQNSIEELDLNLPFIGTVEQKAETVNSKNSEKSLESSAGENIKRVSAATPVPVDMLDTLQISTGEIGNFQLTFKLFGFYEIKTVKVNVCDETQIIPCGIPVGIYIETDGIMVVDIGDIVLADGSTKCPASDLIWPGDYILSVDGVAVSTKEELVKAINASGTENDGFAILEIRRNGERITVRIKPVCDAEGSYKIGAWIRDDCQGLGTLTFIDADGYFGALGHGISDVDTGKIVNVCGGRLYCAKIWSIVKGKAGAPGEVVGSIHYDANYYLGNIVKNTEIGIYGECAENIYNYIDSYALTVAYKQDVHEGKAYVRSFIDGTIRDYEINITNIDLANNNINKGISFTVTDQELLDMTGGIIQGMSGSPIIQDNKVIGAVTHVLVNDSAKGYGIFIETMLEQAGK